MIRVLHVIDHLGLGGAQTAVLDMLRNRDQKTFAVEVAVLHGRGPFADALEAEGIPVHSLAANKWPPVYLVTFLQLLAQARYDVVHFHLQASNWLMKPLAAAAGAAVRISHDHTSGDLHFRGMASLLPDGWSHWWSTRVIAVSDGVADFLTRWEAVPTDAIEVIANGVDEQTFRPADAEQRLEARKRWGLPADGLIVGSMGRLAPEKNFALLPELAVRHPDLTFVVAGSGPEADRLTARCHQLGVSERVVFLGSISDRSGFYHALDMFLLPSLHEGLPMALLEAMASGIPLLASRLEGIAAALDEEKEGLLAPAGDLEEFSSQLERLEGNPSLRALLAAAARVRLKAHFSASRTARRVESVYLTELGIAPDRLVGQ